MEIINWRFKDVGPEIASVSTRMQVDIARYRTLWGLSEDHPVLQTNPKYPSTPAYDESQITTIQPEEYVESTIEDSSEDTKIIKPEEYVESTIEDSSEDTKIIKPEQHDGSNSTNDSLGDINPSATKRSTVSASPKKTRSRKKTV